jgi:hypothetical protein
MSTGELRLRKVGMYLSARGLDALTNQYLLAHHTFGVMRSLSLCVSFMLRSGGEANWAFS